MLKSYYNKETKILTIPYTFNKELKDIPNETKEIIFKQNYEESKYSYFNQEIKEGILPNSLTNIIFGDHFDQEIKEGVFPNSLTSISFGYHFNQEIKKGVLPTSLINTSFWSHSKIRYNIPDHIKTLNINFNLHSNICNKNIDNIPENIEKIIIDKSKIKFLKKIPFECIVTDRDGNIINIYSDIH